MNKKERHISKTTIATIGVAILLPLAFIYDIYALQSITTAILGVLMLRYSYLFTIYMFKSLAKKAGLSAAQINPKNNKTLLIAMFIYQGVLLIIIPDTGIVENFKNSPYAIGIFWLIGTIIGGYMYTGFFLLVTPIIKSRLFGNKGDDSND